MNAFGYSIDETVVRLRGDIDRQAADTFDDLADDISATGISPVRLDFSTVDYINSTGIALIVGLLGRARAAGLELEAEGLSDHYRHVFEITRLSDFIKLTGSTRGE